MARGEIKGIIWFDEIAFYPKNADRSVKIIPMPTANMETKVMSNLINLQLLEHNNKERIKKLVRCHAYDGK